MPADYRDSPFYGKCILAPMVRIGQLGFRLLCASRGADVVFTEEVVGARLVRCTREVTHYPHEPRPVAEYASSEPFKKGFKRAVAFSTLAGRGERAAVVLQLGVSDPAVAARAALLCAEDVDGVDVNMGCPKKFSVQNGFGAALMQRPAVAGAILRAIEASANSAGAVAARGGRALCISFKTRLCETAELTAALLGEILAAAGHTRDAPVVHAITLHARLPTDRPDEAPRYALAADTVRLCRARPETYGGVCFVLNGSLHSRADGAARAASLGFDAHMLARAALYDCRVFHRAAGEREEEGDQMAPFKEAFLFAVKYRTPFAHFKYHLTRAFPERETLKPLMPFVQTKLRCYADCYSFFPLTEDEIRVTRECEQALTILDAPHDDSPTAQGVKRPREEVEVEVEESVTAL